MHKIYTLLLIIGSISTFTGQASADEVKPPLFIASYKLYSSGFEIAAMERSMSKTGDTEYVYLSTTSTIGIVAMLHKDHIVEESRWKSSDAQLVPLHYSYSRSQGKKNRKVDIKFDWDKNQTIQQVNGQNLEMPLPEGALDKLLYQYALMRDAADGQFPVTYHIAVGGKMKQYDFERLPEETVATPLGDFSAIRIQSVKPVDDKKLTIWCAPTLNYLPVKVEHTEDGTTTTAVLQTVEWL